MSFLHKAMLCQTALLVVLPFLRRRRGIYRFLVTLMVLHPCVLFIGLNLTTGPRARVKQKRSLAEIRSVATAVEEYATDRGNYPVPARVPGRVDTGLRVASWSYADPRPVAELRTYLEPSYIKNLPARDGWGSTIYYDSDGTHYAVIAPAEGGTLEPWRWSREGAGSFWWEDFIFSDGRFVKY